MDSRPNVRRLVGTFASLLVAALLLTPAFGDDAFSQDRVKGLLQYALELEGKGDWERACYAYEEILRLDRDRYDARARYQQSLRRLLQSRRHSDPSYLNNVLTLKYTQALRLFEIVLHNLLDGALDKQRLDAGHLVRGGLEELRNALVDPVFCDKHLRGAKPQDLLAFRVNLQSWIQATDFLTREQAIEQIREVSMQALSSLGLSATTTIMECTCGACLALDEYTVYLTPGQFRELADLLKGEIVGVGLTLGSDGKGLVVLGVQPGTPAAEPVDKNGKRTGPIIPGDRVYSIDRKPAGDLSVEAALRLLEGEVGSTVELMVSDKGVGRQRLLVLQRKPVQMRSVEADLLPGGIGYLQITSFQETTPLELEEAILALKKAQMRALILDLRGNRGGLLDVAVEVTQKFLASGIIVSVQHQDARLNTVYHARNPAALTLPMVALVNGDTASAAEIVAGALKDNHRARLIGQTTYGKGCAQGLLKLPTHGLLKVPAQDGGMTTGGIRITVARFFSPSGQCYTGRGVVPHLHVERNLLSSNPTEDHQLNIAKAEVLRILEQIR